MDLPQPLPEALATTAVLCVARVAGFVTIGTLPLGPGVPVVVRVALAWALSVAAIAWAWPAAAASADGMSLLIAVPAEGAVGAILGLSVACVTAAAGWAGGVLGSISGLSWADDYSGGPPEATTPLARLVWWVAAAAFVSGGGARMLLAGLLESFARLPLASGLDTGASGMLLVSLGLASRLAVTLALPALVAVLAWHVSAAIGCRVLPLSPSTGLLQGTAAVVLLAAIWLGGPTWTTGIAEAMTVTCDMVFQRAVPAAGAPTP